METDQGHQNTVTAHDLAFVCANGCCQCMNSCQSTGPRQLRLKHAPHSTVSPYILTCRLTHTHTHAYMCTCTHISPFSSQTYHSSYHVNSCDMVRLGGWFISECRAPTSLQKHSKYRTGAVLRGSLYSMIPYDTTCSAAAKEMREGKKQCWPEMSG